VLDLNATVTGVRLARLPQTKQKNCIFNIIHFVCNYILLTKVEYQHVALHSFIISQFSDLCWLDLLAIFKESLKT
jgi:hypothetical protein